LVFQDEDFFGDEDFDKLLKDTHPNYIADRYSQYLTDLSNDTNNNIFPSDIMVNPEKTVKTIESTINMDVVMSSYS